MEKSFSRIAVERMRMPSSAARAIAIVVARGVPMPKAHGHETTRTVNEWSKAEANVPIIIHPINVAAAIPITAGIKTYEIRSTNCWIGDRVRCASSIKRMNCA